MTPYAQELAVGNEIVRRAGRIALSYWRTGIAADAKSDDSPVTQADRECEAAITSALDEHFPDDGLLGEEGALRESTNGRRWIIDPIDGTRDFLRGNPMWSVLLALEEAGEVVAGWAYFPALDELASATRGGGAHINGTRIHASSISDPNRAVLSLDAFTQVKRYPWHHDLVDFMQQFWAVRSFGGCFDAVMVSRGMAEVWIETAGKPWDFAPLKIIAEEAGACYFDFTGRAGIDGGNCVICAPGMEKMAREFVGCPPA